MRILRSVSIGRLFIFGWIRRIFIFGSFDQETSVYLCIHCLSSCAKSQDPCGVWIATISLRYALQ